ncbi:FeoB-associated Cys-rich membrane protein [Carboxylicivirga taeanensis]|uniref:FeoB-associated Cys-rich membrane protein n=1 Tax=Carboxylicivirga taeanensis TaxID=1416875 RepID=UPI003F6DB4A7
MIQEIITYLIVGWAFYKVFNFFFRVFKPAPGKTACSSGSCGCSAKTELFSAIKKGKYPTLVE